jgi:hypothetical protein
MMSRRIIPFLLVVFTGTAVVLVAQAPTRPGEMTQARVWIENRSPNEAIPVAIQSSATPVRVTGDPATPLPIVAVRQVWEYRSLQFATNVELTRGLVASGNEGWEAVGVVSYGAAGVTVLLKRPR